jgi:S-adenosylmethionine hydrolase
MLAYYGMPNSGAPPPVITLTTDFGLSNTFVGVMKGVILSIAPNVRLVDLTHAIAPQNIVEASARLEAAVGYFPQGSIHLVVVDPGVGSDRAAVIVRTERSIFVAPDNGVLTLPLGFQPPIEAVQITASAAPFLLSPVSATFHGRDVFAPVAAHIAAGVPLARFGDLCDPERLVKVDVPAVAIRRPAGSIEAHATVLYVDHFGNLVTTLRPADLEPVAALLGTRDLSGAEVAVGGRAWHGIVETFASVPEGAPLAYWGSAGRLEIAVRNGNAARELGVNSSDEVVVRMFSDCAGNAPSLVERL